MRPDILTHSGCYFDFVTTPAKEQISYYSPRNKEI
jgi:hypothetical protein